MMGNVIELMVNRHKVQIPASSIVYASVQDKLCKIVLDSGEELNLFITISELVGQLGEEDFLRVSRSSLVAYTAVEMVDYEDVILHGGVRIPYSRSRRTEIQERAKECIARQAERRGGHRPIEELDCARRFSFWDEVPVGFCVLELIPDGCGRFTDFRFRYANQALAGLAGVPRDELVGRAYGQVFCGSHPKWLAMHSKVAFAGEPMEWIDYSPDLGKELLVICYQPAYGYCACIVRDATDKYYLQMKR